MKKNKFRPDDGKGKARFYLRAGDFGARIRAAGVQMAEHFVDGECFLCGGHPETGEGHEEHCPFAGMTPMEVEKRLGKMKKPEVDGSVEMIVVGNKYTAPCECPVCAVTKPGGCKKTRPLELRENHDTVFRDQPRCGSCRSCKFEKA